MSASTESEIKASLQSLLSAITRSDAATIAREMTKLDEIARCAKERLHPQLVHFLERRSYAKALAFLGGESLLRPSFAGQATNPPGGCGGGKG